MKHLGEHADFDEQYWRPLLATQYDRAQNKFSRTNHRKACSANPEDRTNLLKQVKIPTLIIHGTEDPIFPLAHGKALASAIKNSKLLVIDNMGHALNPLFQARIIAAICRHIKQVD